MEKQTKYEVWKFGLMKDGTPKAGYEECYASFKEQGDATAYAYEKAFEPFKGCAHTNVLVEQVEYDENGNASCVDVLFERAVEKNEFRERPSEKHKEVRTDYQVWLMALNKDGSFDTTNSKLVASFEKEAEATRYVKTRKFKPIEGFPYTSVRVELTHHFENGGQACAALILETPVE